MAVPGDESAEVLTLNPIYFQLRSPLDRRLYELARKHCGNQDKWRIRIDKLQKKCGSKQERKHFVKHLRETIEADHIPDYRFELDGDFVMVYRRAAEAEPAKSVTAIAPPEPSRQGQGASQKIFISTDAIEQAKKEVPGSDVYWLENTYHEWIKANGIEPARNEDARFLSWVKSFTKGMRAS